MERTSSGLTVVRHDELDAGTAQTPGLPRLEGVSPEKTGSAGLWMGRVTGIAGMNSGPHHHGEAETGGYVLSGTARVFYGETFEEYVDVYPGDFIYVPAFVPHIETNLSKTEPIEFVTCRFPGNVVINLDGASLHGPGQPA